ncbi:hypothetical protein BDD14_4106 [Edaphobacter modestus]|uniref:Uncharacterized protein n=2 Tax=Edaphobacter modestus TaxID=388466 RepID=A0A4V2G4W8_9BACT|nr:hypothetical protein BDD14_4106 [Edaphobacter modestus]
MPGKIVPGRVRIAMKNRPRELDRLRIALTLPTVLAVSFFLPAQQNTPPPDAAPSSQPSGQKSDAEAAKAPLTPEEKKRADLIADTEKLYKLTQELKAEVAKSNKDTLSVSVVKKAQEVERLAKSIKERTRTR